MKRPGISCRFGGAWWHNVPSAVVTIAIAGLAGCPSAPLPGVAGDDSTTGEVVDGNRDDSTTGEVVDDNGDDSSTDSSGKTSGEPNDTFAEAVVAVFDDRGLARLEGTIALAGDLDVYQLGGLSAGDRLVVDGATTGSVLDMSVAVFDEQERLVYHNDDRGGEADRFLDSYIEWIVRHDSSAYYLVVTNAAFAAPGDTTGSYTVDVEVIGGFAMTAPVGQTIVLDFDGGTVNIPALGEVTIEPFDAGAIARSYDGQDEALKEVIREVIAQNFERFEVTVLTSDDPPPANGVVFSTVLFGSFNASAFGIAQGVDAYNVDYCDDAIIYSESFTPRVFSRFPSVSELGTAIGNVAAHEAGHLLGLNHVDDDLALMDDRSAADAFLEDQEFTEAPLSSDIMSIGTQDAVMLLAETVGLR